MPTNLDLDDSLIKEAQKIGKHKTKKETVNEALVEYIQKRKQKKIIELFNQIDYDEDYDYKKTAEKKMKVLVDTSIWSLALRKKRKVNTKETDQLTELISKNSVAIIGVIRQEILSGVNSKKQFNKLKEYLSVFPDTRLNRKDFEYAAELYNTCRKSGIQCSNIDFLICSVAIENDFPIFTTDKDFYIFKKYIPIKIFS